MSQHPAAPTQRIHAAQAASVSSFPRSHQMPWTQPLRPQPKPGKSSTPTKPIDRGLDLTLSPIKSPKTTMTTEELFAVIHRSKKKLNMAKTEQQQTDKKASPTATSPRTSLQNFKMLLLQKGSKDEKRISAVEQLRLSKDSPEPKYESPKKLAKKWRFNSPRSDVLSSTILEDCREEKSAGFVVSHAFDSSKAKRALPEPPQYQSRLSSRSIYAKITAPIQSPERLNPHFESPVVPCSRRFSPFPNESGKVLHFSNGRPFSNQRAFSPNKSVRSPNVSLETAL